MIDDIGLIKEKMKTNSGLRIIYILGLLLIMLSLIIYLITVFPKKTLDDETSTIMCEGDIIFTFYNAGIRTNGEWSENKYDSIITKLCKDPTHIKGDEKPLEVNSSLLEKNFTLRLIFKRNWKLFENNCVNALLVSILAMILLSIFIEFIFSRQSNMQFDIKRIFKIRKF
jgi:hypothetical protein